MALKTNMVIGILGGGQLGRYLAIAAAKLGFDCHIYCPDKLSPAFDVSKYHTIANYDDENSLFDFSQNVDVITYEFENIPLEAIAILEKSTSVYPPAKALEVSQDRLLEKQFLDNLSITVGKYKAIDKHADLATFANENGLPIVLKQRRFGYDGKGQHVLKTEKDLNEVSKIANQGNMIVEQFISFFCEVSVIIARSKDGHVEIFTPGMNIHINNILDTTFVPAEVDEMIIEKAKVVASKIVRSLQYVGVMGVEFFVVNNENGQDLLVNEIAPRVHNSGHWTLDGDIVSQFEQHIRAITNCKLKSPKLLSPIIMKNLIGDDIDEFENLINDKDIFLHLYGKKDKKVGRKMGHYNKFLQLKA